MSALRTNAYNNYYLYPFSSVGSPACFSVSPMLIYFLLPRYTEAANDFEAARLADPDNPTLVVNYSRLHEVEVIVLCGAGMEPIFE